MALFILTDLQRTHQLLRLGVYQGSGCVQHTQQRLSHQGPGGFPQDGTSIIIHSNNNNNNNTVFILCSSTAVVKEKTHFFLNK